ncbi:MAG: glycosyltransferase [Gemmatimonadota bacterium]|nr:glycosyltransferase [Gemmatimonadota bacterium]
MKAAYVGITSPGSTSRMRAEWLRKLTPGWEWEWMDTDPPLQDSTRVWRTLAFRAKRGHAVNRINEMVTRRFRDKSLDLVWVDKGVFLRIDTVRDIRSRTRRLVHYTPDTAFRANRSFHFESTVGLYDLVVTTKSFDVDDYKRRIDPEKLLVTTQGYDPSIHYPRHTDDERRREALFVGLAEPDRERCIAALLRHEIPVRLGGRGWGPFVYRYRSNPLLAYEGEDIFGDDYADLLSKSWVGLGLLSKKFPELHTTRTFEIPACGAVLATEQTSETTVFFNDSEALFFTDHASLVARLGPLLRDDTVSSLSETASAGKRRVVADGRDYESILAAILSDARLSLP